MQFRSALLCNFQLALTANSAPILGRVRRPRNRVKSKSRALFRHHRLLLLAAGNERRNQDGGYIAREPRALCGARSVHRSVLPAECVTAHAGIRRNASVVPRPPLIGRRERGRASAGVTRCSYGRPSGANARLGARGAGMLRNLRLASERRVD